MRVRPIIISLLDTDLYKLTMMQAVLHNFPSAWVRYEFQCRGDEGPKLAHLVNEVEEHVDHLCCLRFTEKELAYLSSIRFMKKDFIGFLRCFSLSREFVKIRKDEGRLRISIEGPWYATILFETPVLAIVNELYNNGLVNSNLNVMMNGDQYMLDQNERFMTRWDESKLSFGDFGTRRRWSRDWHEKIMEKIALKKEHLRFFGTSNVWLAMRLGLRPFGTMAHEWLMAGQAMDVPLRRSQQYMLERWIDEYRGDLGIALTDVIGIDAFCQDCDLYITKLYDGFRHDSGDPIAWFHRMREHVVSMNQDPMKKQFVFSNGLTIDDAESIHRQTRHLGNTMFAIGTSFTNNTTFQPLRIVIKMMECNGRPLAKITDEPGKGTYEDRSHYDLLCGAYDKTE